MDMIGPFAVWSLAVYTITSVILGEIWRAKRSKRRAPRRDWRADRDTLDAWLAEHRQTPGGANLTNL